jgi:hypothetical protein
MTPETLLKLAETAAMVTVTLASALIPFAAKLLREKTRAEHLKVFLGIVDSTFWIVEGLAEKTPTAVDNKAAAALNKLREELGRDLKPGEKAAAELRFGELATLERRNRG